MGLVRQSFRRRHVGALARVAAARGRAIFALGRAARLGDASVEVRSAAGAFGGVTRNGRNLALALALWGGLRRRLSGLWGRQGWR